MEQLKQPPGACPICKASLPAGDFRFIQNYSDSGKTWSLYECPKCFVQFWMPFELPQENYYEQEQIDGEPRHFLTPWNFKKFFQITPAAGGRLFDIGCGAGEFLAMCKKAGYSVYGLEVNEYLVKQVRAKEIDCYFGYLKDFASDFEKKNQEPFDCVTFFEVLEHLIKPRDFLRNVNSILKPGGIAVFSVPFRERSEIFKMTDYPPGHVTRWNADSLSKILADCGFETERVKIRPLSLQYMVGSFFQAYKFRNVNKFIKLMLSVFLGFVCWIPMILKGGKGNRIFIIARKKI